MIPNKYIYHILCVVSAIAFLIACAKVSIPVANGVATATVPTFLTKQSFSLTKTSVDKTTDTLPTTNTLTVTYNRDTNADAAAALKTAAENLSAAAAALATK